MVKIRRVLLALGIIAVQLMASAMPVAAATTIYGYPQFEGEYFAAGRVLLRGLDNSRGESYSELDIIISTVSNGASGVTVAVAADGAALTDESTAANNATATDTTLLPAVPAQDDAYYFGSTVPFNGVRIDIGTQGEGVWTTIWEYWNGTAWTNITATDTDGVFTAAAGNHEVTWTIPTAWVKKTVTTTTPAATTALMYFVRARVSAYTSVVTAPDGDQAWILCDNVIAGTVAITGIEGTISEAEGWVGNGRRPTFCLMVKDVEDGSRFYAEIQGTVVWDGTTITSISGRAYGHINPVYGTKYNFSGTFRGEPAA